MQVAKIAITISTLGPVGYLPFFPGTWGSAVAIILWWLLRPRMTFLSFAVSLIILIVLAIICSSSAEQKLGKDAKPIVIDEVAGQILTVIFVETTFLFGLLAFLLFRLFDIWKPFPVYQSQKLPGGWGIVVDDLLAALYSIFVLFIIQRLWFG